MAPKVVALHYGFLDGAGFSTALAELQEVGALTVGLCVGTAAWNSLAGSPKSMLSNVVNAHQGCTRGSFCGKDFLLVSVSFSFMYLCVLIL